MWTSIASGKCTQIHEALLIKVGNTVGRGQPLKITFPRITRDAD